MQKQCSTRTARIKTAIRRGVDCRGLLRRTDALTTHLHLQPTRKGENMEEPNYKELLLQFLASLTFADHMGDAGSNMREVCKRIGLPHDWDDFDDLGRILKNMGVTSLYGTAIGED